LSLHFRSLQTLRKNGDIGNFDSGYSMLTPQTNLILVGSTFIEGGSAQFFAVLRMTNIPCASFPGDERFRVMND
jgi:hypothetical protein